MQVYDKIKYGDRLRQNPKKLVKKQGKSHKISQKLVKSSKNHVVLYYINEDTCKIMHMRTVAVQPPILCKKFFHYTISMGVHRYENLIL